MVEKWSVMMVGAAAGGVACVALGMAFAARKSRVAEKEAGQTVVDSNGMMAADRKKVDRVPLEKFPATRNDLILRAARGEATERVPVWMMRQAGRYLPEFMEVRKTKDFFKMCQDPETAALITLQPLERFSTLDGVIVFSDILVIPQAMGLETRMDPGKGPVFPSPLVTPADISRLNLHPNIENTLGYVFDVVNLVRQQVNGRVPVLGFSGAPFTLMGYMIQGRVNKAKKWLIDSPAESHQLLQALTDIVVQYTVGKVRAGAQLLQIFESNAGDLSPELFKEFSLPYLVQIAKRVKEELKRQGLPVVPMTVFARGANHEGALELLADSDYDTVGLDWCVDPAVARRRIGSKASVQGNLDPSYLYASRENIRTQVRKMLQGFGTERYIANLGHGMMPDHDWRHAEEFILAVQEISLEMNKSSRK